MLGGSWPPWAALGPPRGALGALLGGSWGPPAALPAAPGSLWAPLGASLAALLVLFAALGTPPGALGASWGAAGGCLWSPEAPTSIWPDILRGRSALKDTSSDTGVDRNTRVSRGCALRRASVPRNTRKHLTRSLSRRSFETAARQMPETRGPDGRFWGGPSPNFGLAIELT